MKLSKDSYIKYFESMNDKSAIKRIMKHVHNNKKFTTVEIIKLYIHQSLSNSWTSVIESFVHLFKFFYKFIFGVLGPVFLIASSPVMIWYKVASSKNSYKAASEYFNLDEKD